jgi:hypothetical protein
MPGEKSARKIPLKATTLTEAREAMAKERTQAREGGLQKGGVKPNTGPVFRNLRLQQD